MGNQSSKNLAYAKLTSSIPAAEDFTYINADGKQKPARLFANSQDRDQFIYAIIILISSNGRRNLDEASFKVLYGRRSNGRLVATVVAMNDVEVVAKIEPDGDGVTQVEAFKALREFVEGGLNVLLQGVPGGASSRGDVGSSSAGAGMADRPPAYDLAKKS